MFFSSRCNPQVQFLRVLELIPYLQRDNCTSCFMIMSSVIITHGSSIILIAVSSFFAFITIFYRHIILYDLYVVKMCEISLDGYGIKRCSAEMERIQISTYRKKYVLLLTYPLVDYTWNDTFVSNTNIYSVNNCIYYVKT